MSAVTRPPTTSPFSKRTLTRCGWSAGVVVVVSTVVVATVVVCWVVVTCVVVWTVVGWASEEVVFAAGSESSGRSRR